jgi:hypothetical protein
MRALVAADVPNLDASKVATGTLATARLGSGTPAAGKYVDGAAGAWTALPASGANALGTYLVQTATNAPANAQVLAALATGLAKVTTTTGVVSIAAAGTDYLTPTGNGSGLTALTATNLGSGTVPTARLATGTANSSTFLRGDQTWAAPSGTGANAAGTYLVQTATNAPANAQVLGTLATGLAKITTTTGVVSIAAAGTDYLTPTGSGASLTGLTKAQVGLSAVENTALSTWAGSANLTTLGTVTAGSLDAARIASGTLATARIGSGTPAASKYVDGGTGAWTTLPSGGSGDWFATLTNAEVSITGATTLTSAAFDHLHTCSGTTANYTVTLPAVSGNAGKFVAFRMAATLTKFVTLAGNAAEAIDGSNTRILWANETAVLYCDGTAWTKVGGKSIPMAAVMALSATAGAATFAGSTNYVIPYDVVLTDNTGAMADTTNHKITVVRGSVYLCSIFVRWNSLPGNQARLIGAMVPYGGGAYIIGMDISGQGGGYPVETCTQTATLAAGAAVEGNAVHFNGSNLQLYGDSVGDGNLMALLEVPQW